MKPYEKAKELVKKYSPLLPYYNENDNKNKSIQCALIAVDEILGAVTTIADKKYDYWQEVKEHLKNM